MLDRFPMVTLLKQYQAQVVMHIGLLRMCLQKFPVERGCRRKLTALMMIQRLSK